MNVVGEVVIWVLALCGLVILQRQAAKNIYLRDLLIDTDLIYILWVLFAVLTVAYPAWRYFDYKRRQQDRLALEEMFDEDLPHLLGPGQEDETDETGDLR